MRAGVDIVPQSVKDSRILERRHVRRSGESSAKFSHSAYDVARWSDRAIPYRCTKQGNLTSGPFGGRTELR